MSVVRQLRNTVLSGIALASVATARAQQPFQPSRLSPPTTLVDTSSMDYSGARVVDKKTVRVFAVDVYGDKLGPALQQTMGAVGYRAVPSAERFAGTVDRLIAAAKGHPIRQVNFFGHGSPGLMLAARDEMLTTESLA